MKVLLILIMIHFVFFGSALGFDTVPRSIDLSKSICPTVYITTMGNATGLYYDSRQNRWATKDTNFTLQGSGFVIKPGYIVTAAHVVSPDELFMMIGRHSYFKGMVIKVDIRLMTFSRYPNIESFADGVPAYPLYIDKELDIALLRYQPMIPRVFMSNARIEFTLNDLFLGSWSELGSLVPGVTVATIVMKRDEETQESFEFEVRYGKVLDRSIVGIMPTSDIASFGALHFSTDLLVYSGDSGSPVYAFQDGEPVFVGVITDRHLHEDISYSVRLDLIKKLLEAYDE